MTLAAIAGGGLRFYRVRSAVALAGVRVLVLCGLAVGCWVAINVLSGVASASQSTDVENNGNTPISNSISKQVHRTVQHVVDKIDTIVTPEPTYPSPEPSGSGPDSGGTEWFPDFGSGRGSGSTSGPSAYPGVRDSGAGPEYVAQTQRVREEQAEQQRAAEAARAEASTPDPAAQQAAPAPVTQPVVVAELTPPAPPTHVIDRRDVESRDHNAAEHAERRHGDRQTPPPANAPSGAVLTAGSAHDQGGGRGGPLAITGNDPVYPQLRLHGTSPNPAAAHTVRRAALPPATPD